MKIVVLNEDITIKQYGKIVELKKDNKYLIADFLEAFIREKEKQHNRRLFRRCVDVYSQFSAYKGQDLTNKNLLIVRTGGIGDIIFLTPFAKHLKEVYPSANIFIACAPAFTELYNELEFLTACVPMPIDLKTVGSSVGYDVSPANSYFISFEGLVEDSKEALNLNIYDLHRKVFNLPEFEYKPEIAIKYLRRKHKEKRPNLTSDKLHIAFQFSSSSYLRTWKPEYIIQFLSNWDIDGTVFYIFDHPSKNNYIKAQLAKINTQPGVEIVNLVGTELEESIVWLDCMDLVIGPDSSFMHLAACLQIPMVGLFGAFHTDLRLKYYNNALGINAMSDCEFAKTEYKVCGEHGQSCSKAMQLNRIFAPCMDLLTPGHVRGIIYKFLQDNKVIEDNKTSKDGVTKFRLIASE